MTVAQTVALTVAPVPMVAQTAARVASRARRTAAPVPMVEPTAARTAALIPDSSTPAGGGAASRLAPGQALRRCTALPMQTFAEEVWGRSASLSRAAELPRRGFEDLFTLDAVDRLVSLQSLRTPFLKVAKDGETLATATFTRGGGAGAAIGDQVGDDQLSRLFADGSTIVLQALHRTHAPLLRFGQALAADLGHPVQVNAYITPPQSQGFSHHYDVHDVFVLQVAGEKRWVIHAPVLMHPMRDQPWTERRAEVAAAAEGEPLLDIVLRPGDALYLPRGFIHAATALGGISAHLTVGVQEWTRKHLLDHVVAMISGTDAVRVTLPIGVDVTDPAAISGELSATIGAMRSQLDALAADVGGRAAGPVARGMRLAARSATRAEPVGPMAQARAIARLDTGTALRIRDGLRPAVRHDCDATVLDTAEVTVTLTSADRDAVDRFASGQILRAAELSLDGEVHLARTLLQHAIAVEA